MIWFAYLHLDLKFIFTDAHSSGTRGRIVEVESSPLKVKVEPTDPQGNDFLALGFGLAAGDKSMPCSDSFFQNLLVRTLELELPSICLQSLT